MLALRCMKTKDPRKDRHVGIQIRFRAPDLITLDRWKAAAEADGRSLNNWLGALATAASLPIRKKNARGA